MNIYMLTSEDLSHLGGPMGSEYTTTNYVKPFEDLEAAQEYAEKEYKRGKITWTKDKKKAKWCSGDLAFVMYNIEEVKVGVSKKFR